MSEKTYTKEDMEAYREALAKFVEDFPDKILHVYKRPGSPPGNGYIPTTHAIIAERMRTIPLP